MDSQVRLYDEEECTCLFTFEQTMWVAGGHNNRVQSVKFLPDDSNLIISGGWD